MALYAFVAVLTILGSGVSIVTGIDSCTSQLMIQSTKLVPSNALKASSVFDGNHAQDRARLDTQKVGKRIGAWAAKSNDNNQWIEVDLGQTYFVRGVVTQGRSDHPQWVTRYKVSYGTKRNQFTNYAQTLPGNTDQNSKKVNMLSKPFKARYIRINPRAWNGHISLRFDVYACTLSDYCAYYVRSQGTKTKVASAKSTLGKPVGLLESDGVVMSKDDVTKLQCYSAIILDLQLPSTLQPVNYDIRDFHKTAKTNAGTWKSSILPGTIQVARSVSAYSSQSISSFRRITALSNDIFSGSASKKATSISEVKALLIKLKRAAETNMNTAGKTFSKLRSFTRLVEQDQKKAKQIFDKYVAIGRGSKLKSLISQLNSFKSKISQLEKDYNHAVVVAATSVTYGWIPIVGWIAGATVAAKFAADAVRLNNEIGATRSSYAHIYSQLQQHASVVMFCRSQLNSLITIQATTSNAIPVFGRIESTWGSIKDDIESILSGTLNFVQPKQGVLPFQVDIAKTSWNEVKKRADDYVRQVYFTKTFS